MKKKPKNTSTSALKFGVRFIFVFLLTASFCYVAGPLYVRSMLPLFAFEIELVHPEYEVISYGIEKIGKIDNIYYIIKIKRGITNELGFSVYGKEVKLNIVTSALYIQPLIIFPLLFSWPGFSIRERLRAVLISVPFLLATASIDIPPYFISRIEMSFPVGSLFEQIRIMLFNFFSNGGRQFLALLATLAVMGLTRITITSPAISDPDRNNLIRTPAISDPGRNAPCPCGSGKKYKRCCMK